MRKVPSVDEADDGVPAEAGADEVEEADTVVLALNEFRPPGRQSSRPNRGRGSDIGRSVRRAGRSLLRGSVGNSSDSSYSGVPGRLLLLPSVGPFLVAVAAAASVADLLRKAAKSTSQGIMRGCCEWFLQSPELSVESLETRRLGRLLAVCDEQPTPPVLFVPLLLPASRLEGGVEEHPRVEDALVDEEESRELTGWAE